MSSKPTRRKDVLDSIINLKKRQREINGLSRQNFSGLGSSEFGAVSSTGSSGGSGANGGNNDNNHRIKSMGDTMTGPLGFHALAKTIASGALDLSEPTGAYSSRIIVNGQSNAADDLEVILGFGFAGQLLFLQPATTGAPITLQDFEKTATAWSGSSVSYNIGDVVSDVSRRYTCYTAHTSSASTDPSTGADWETVWYRNNIHINGATELVVAVNDIILLQYDQSSTGAWIVVSGGGTGSWVGTATSDLNMGSFDIYGVDKLKMVIDNTTAWNAADTGFDFTSTGLHAHVISGDAFEVWSNGTSKNLLAGESGLQVFVSGTKYMDIGSSSSDFYNNLYIHDNYMQFTKMTAPTHSVSSYRYLFQDTADNHLKIRTNTGLIDLETSSGGSFPSPVTTDLDMNDNDILGVNLLDFDGTSTEIRGLTNLNFYHTDRQITSTGSYAGLLHTVASSEKHGFLIGGSTKMEVSSDLEMSIDIDMNDNDVLGVDQLSFSVSGQYMTGNSSGVNYYVPTGDSHKLYVGTTKIADLGAGSWDSTVDLYMGGTNQIKQLADPSLAQDAATKAYVDANSGGGSSGANTSLSNLTSTGEAHFVKLGNTSNWTAEQQFNQGIDLGSESVNGVHDYNFGAGGGKLNFNSYGYISASGSNKIYVGSAGATFKDSALFEHSVQMNNGLTMQGGDVSLSGTGRLDLVSTGGSPGSFGGYVAIKIGGSTKYLMYYQ